MKKLFYSCYFIIIAILQAKNACAEALPAKIDAGRIEPSINIPAPAEQNNMVTVPTISSTVPVPKNAQNIHFILKDIRIEGATAFSEANLRDIYASSLGKNITLDNVYTMAAALTQRYRNCGYFLSLAYVPNQHIKNGIVTIKVIEGHIGNVDMQDSLKNNRVVREFIKQLLAKKPLKASEMESFLLRLNDLPGYSFRAVLSPEDKENKSDQGSVTLNLVPAKKSGSGTVSFDNNSSRFLGPNEVGASYSTSFFSLQQTTISGVNSLPLSPLHAVTLEHAIIIAPNLTLSANASYTNAKPGYHLEQFDIQSRSISLGTSLNYQVIRQRSENLSVKWGLDGRDTSSDVLNTPFTRDHVRATRISTNYDNEDAWRGSNVLSTTISQGLDILGSSKDGNPYLSRAKASPNFTKGEFSLSRLQGITENWSMLASASGQLASGPLYSSEQFGYGGQVFGRAYDSSEITGDNGVSGAVELRYSGFGPLKQISLTPYEFYDIGEVWNLDSTEEKHQTGSSAGLGIRAGTNSGWNSNLSLAWPLTRDISTPIYGQTKTGPRIMLQLSKNF